MRTRFLLLASIALLIAASAAAQKPTVVLISLDTFRADLLAPYGGPAALAPEMNALARRGTIFSNCSTPVPITLPAHAAMLTGCDPARAGLHDNGRGKLAGGIPHLAETFKAAGYDTRAVLAAIVLEGRYGLERGFSSYDDGFGPTLKRSADAVTDRAISALKEAKGPLFLWAHYYDTHEIYDPPEPYASKYPKSPYQGAAAFVDAEVGRLLKALPKNAIVAVVADHGESLGEHGEQTHGILLFQATVKVPFILFGAGIPEGKSVGAACSLSDLAPTLTSLAGVKLGGKPDGRDLSPALSGKTLAARTFPLETWLPYDEFRWMPLEGVTDGRWKWIRGSSLRLYDTLSDPGETKDLSSTPTKEASALRSGLPPAAQSAPPSGQVDESIRGLGYNPVPSAGGSLKNLPDPHDKIPVMRKLDEGRDLRRRGQNERAVALFKEAVEADKGNPTAWFETGETLRRLGKVEEAAKSLDKALAISPMMAVAWVSRGHCWVALSKNDAAATCYEKALKINPTLIEALNPLAAHYLDLNQPDKAFPLLDRAEAQGFADTGTYLMQGRIHLIQNKPEQAQKDFFLALQHSQDKAGTVKATADIYLIRKMYNEAIRIYEEGIRLFPDYPPMYLTLALVYLEGESPERALSLYQKAIQLDLTPEDRKNVQEIIDELVKQGVEAKR